MKNIEDNDLEDMVFGMELTKSEVEKILDMKYIDTPVTGHALMPGLYDFTVNNFLLKSFIPAEVKVNTTIDDIRLRSKLTTTKTISLQKNLVLLNIGIYPISLRTPR